MRPSANYLKSNKITTIDVLVSQDAVRLAELLLKVDTAFQRQKVSEQLLDELSDGAGIDIVNLKISDTKQYHRKRGKRTVFKQYGYYRSRYIYIQNKTAVRGQILAAKTFIDTLLHEWLHHYDTYKLKLDSIHTKGFYLRLRDLKDKLGF